jgi:hypothetical protein
MKAEGMWVTCESSLETSEETIRHIIHAQVLSSSPQMQFHSCFNYFDNFVGQLAGNQIGNFLLAFDCTLTFMMITVMRNAAGGVREREINKMTCNERSREREREREED